MSVDQVATFISMTKYTGEEKLYVSWLGDNIYHTGWQMFRQLGNKHEYLRCYWVSSL